MAVVNTKSTGITNADATPLVRSSRYIVSSPLLVSVAKVEVAAGDDDGSVYRFIRLPSNAVIHSIGLYNDAITAGLDEGEVIIPTSFDLGLYQTAGNGGAVASATLFATAVDMSVARISSLDALYEANNIVNIEKRIWELLSLSTDSHINYDVALTSITNGTDAGTICLKIIYTI